jgi:16S rRNA (adenine1518-N6/adenine1519-N6)-dimethyltransferase
MAKKYLGQNFLYDPSILTRIVQVAQLSIDDLVVEIGPGHGRLTRMLAEQVKKIIAIELDGDLFEKLKVELIDYRNVELIHGDALRYPYGNLPEFKVVANIPYYITTPAIFKLLDARKQLLSMTLTLQREVAERIIAKPGGKDYGVLSIMVQYHATPYLAFIIPRGAFRPVPKVDSAVIHLKILEKPFTDVKDERLFKSVVKTAFSQRRKVLSNSLKNMGRDAKEWLERAGIDPNRRPETLSIEEFARLADMY